MKKVLVLAAVSAALFTSTAAMAGADTTATQTQSFSFATLTETASLSFDGFDASLGTLNSVHFSWTLDSSLEDTVFNTLGVDTAVGNPLPLSATATTSFDFSVPSGASLSDTNILTTPDFVGVALGAGPQPTVVGSAANVGVVGGDCLSNDGSGGCIPTADLSAFEGGAGLYTVDLASVGSQGGTVPAGIFTGNRGTASGEVSIFYDYTASVTPQPPVPEPMTISLLGLGLAGLGLRKRKQA